MLTIWGRGNAFNVQKVLWLVGELGIPHQHVALGGPLKGLDTPEFLALNPHGRIPVIQDEHQIVWESHAILRYLAASYGQGTWWSTDPGIQSQADRWMDWMLATLQPDFMTGIFLGFYRTPEAQRNWPAIEHSMQRCTQHFKLLDRILSQQPYLAGDHISLADITVGSALYRYFELAIERPDLPQVSAWYRRLQERPPYREQVMVSFADLFGRLDF